MTKNIEDWFSSHLLILPRDRLIILLVTLLILLPCELPHIGAAAVGRVIQLIRRGSES
jgi:hypothetical protein